MNGMLILMNLLKLYKLSKTYLKDNKNNLFSKKYKEILGLQCGMLI